MAGSPGHRPAGGGADRLRILHLILVLGPTNSQYNEHCLPMVGRRELSICTYFPPKLEAPEEIKLFAGDGSLRGFFRALRAALDAGGYDAIHAHAPQSGLLLLVALVAWGRFRRLRRSLVYTVHDSFYDYKPRNKLFMLPTLATYRRVVFCSHAAYESLPASVKRLVGGRYRVVQNAADTARVDRVLARAGYPRPLSGFTVLSVCRLEKVKDPVTLLSAFRLASESDERLVFVGEGSLRPELEREVAAGGLTDRVTLTGLIQREEVFVRCAEADLFVSASHGEGLPVGVMEAMTAGCPVVLSDIAPHRELLAGASFVPLVTPGDTEGFAHQIRRFRSMTGEERRRIGAQCRELVTSRFGLERMHAGYEAVYRDLRDPASQPVTHGD